MSHANRGPVSSFPTADAERPAADAAASPVQRVALPAGYLEYYGIQLKKDAPGERSAAADRDGRALQLRGAEEAAITDSQVHNAAAAGVSGGGGSLPHLDAIQKSFGHHDVSGVQAHTG